MQKPPMHTNIGTILLICTYLRVAVSSLYWSTVRIMSARSVAKELSWLHLGRYMCRLNMHLPYFLGCSTYWNTYSIPRFAEKLWYCVTCIHIVGQKTIIECCKWWYTHYWLRCWCLMCRQIYTESCRARTTAIPETVFKRTISFTALLCVASALSSSALFFPPLLFFRTRLPFRNMGYRLSLAWVGLLSERPHDIMEAHLFIDIVNLCKPQDLFWIGSYLSDFLAVCVVE